MVCEFDVSFVSCTPLAPPYDNAKLRPDNNLTLSGKHALANLPLRVAASASGCGRGGRRGHSLSSRGEGWGQGVCERDFWPLVLIEPMSTYTIVIVSLTFLLAGIVKGVTGMGLPTVAMGLLGTIMPPVGAAAILIVPSFVTNVWQLFAGPSFKALISRLWPMMAGIAVGTLASSSLLTDGNAAWTQAALGAALTVYAAVSLLTWQLSIPRHLERRLSPFVGLIGGVVTGGTGVFVIPAVPYLQSLGLSREDLVQALGLSFTVSTIVLAIGLAAGGAFQTTDLGASVLTVLPALLGMGLGQYIRKRVSPATFRRWFLICLLILGLQLFLRGFQ